MSGELKANKSKAITAETLSNKLSERDALVSEKDNTLKRHGDRPSELSQKLKSLRIERHQAKRNLQTFYEAESYEKKIRTLETTIEKLQIQIKELEYRNADLEEHVRNVGVTAEQHKGVVARREEDAIRKTQRRSTRGGNSRNNKPY